MAMSTVELVKKITDFCGEKSIVPEDYSGILAIQFNEGRIITEFLTDTKRWIEFTEWKT